MEAGGSSRLLLHSTAGQRLTVDAPSVSPRGDRPTDQPTNGPTDLPTDPPIYRSTHRLTDRSTDRLTDLPIDLPIDRPIYRSTYRSTDRRTDRPTDLPINIPIYRSTYRSTDRHTDQPTDLPTNRSTNRLQPPGWTDGEINVPYPKKLHVNKHITNHASHMSYIAEFTFRIACREGAQNSYMSSVPGKVT